MGFCKNDHIVKFYKGQILDHVEEECDGTITLRFASGESLRIVPQVVVPRPVARPGIFTPFASDGEVKQSLKIMEEAKP